MPGGREHLRLELALLPVFLGGVWLLGRDVVTLPELGVFGGAYLLSSFLLSPDLDLRYNSARRRWGPLGFIWIPYSKVFKHRGLSHNPLLGPLTRIGYLFLLGALVIYLLRLGGLQVGFRFSVSKDWLAMIALGLYLPNLLHISYDRLDSGLKRRKRKTRRRR